jgi:hypothetical protein
VRLKGNSFLQRRGAAFYQCKEIDMAKWQKLLGMGLSLALMAPLAIAQDATNSGTETKQPAHPHSINARQHRQERRIRQGVKSGELTPREASRLQAEEKGIARREARMRASGGKFTKGERNAIQRQENRTSKRIYKQKHDRQTVK